MKKVLKLGTLLAFCAPVFAADKCEGGDCPKMKGPRAEMAQKGRERRGPMNPEWKARNKARKAKVRQQEEQLEKLVKEYKKAKEGSKKQAAAREQIAAVLETVREDQVTLRREQLQGFEKRLASMKERLAEEQKPAAKAAWVEMMTDRVIAEDGDLEDALEMHGRMHMRPAGEPFGPAFTGPRPDAEIPPAPPVMKEAK